MLLKVNFQYKGHITKFYVRRKIKEGIEENDEFLIIITKRKLKCFWQYLSLDDRTRQSERKKKEENETQEIGIQFIE